MPATIDHNRIILDVALPRTDGSWFKTHAWLDNGDPELRLSRRVATELGLAVQCDDRECTSPPPRAIRVGDFEIPLDGIKESKIPLRPVYAATVMQPGLPAEINLPSRVLRHYDVLIDFPGHKLTLGAPGNIHFQGSSGKVLVNPDGLVQVPSKIENKKYNLALDLGSSMSFLSAELFDPMETAHPDWPHMTGAVAAANLWGLDDEPKWKLMRVDRVEYGPLFLANVPVVDFPKDGVEFFAKRAGVATVGLIGANQFQNYRVGIDYAHGIVYFDIGRLFNFPEFDVVGLTLRPEDDGRYSVLGVVSVDGAQVADYLVAVDGIPVQGRTMGQVWSMLRGTPGQERRLTLDRGGKQLAVSAQVQHFLAETPDDGEGKKKK